MSAFYRDLARAAFIRLSVMSAVGLDAKRGLNPRNPHVEIRHGWDGPIMAGRAQAPFDRSYWDAPFERSEKSWIQLGSEWPRLVAVRLRREADLGPKKARTHDGNRKLMPLDLP